MSDPLANFKFDNGSGLYLKEYPAKVRVLTTDPLVHVNPKYGSTKFAFVVYNHTAGKAQILDAGAMITQEIQRLHTDEDYGANIQKIDIKIDRQGEGKETRYTVTPLPNAVSLTNEQVAEARDINLSEKVENGVRMSEINSGEKTLTQWDIHDIAQDLDIAPDDIDDKPIDISEIPF